MTAIAGFVHCDGSVWIGGDSAGVGSHDLTIRADEKVFRNGEFLFGFTTSFRMGQLIRYAFSPPLPVTDEDVPTFMATRFVDAIRACLKTGGFARRDNETETGGTFLVGFRERLFLIDADYQIGESRDGYMACGSGAQVALGSLYATADQLQMDCERRMEFALRAAEHHNVMVRGPFTVLHLDPPQKVVNA